MKVNDGVMSMCRVHRGAEGTEGNERRARKERRKERTSGVEEAKKQ